MPMDARPPAVRRIWIPVGIVVLAAAAVAGVWYYPDPEFRNDFRSMISSSAVMLAIFLLAFWLLFLSGMRWAMRIGVLIGAVVMVGGSVASVEFQGNLRPIFHFRWEHRERGPRESTAQVPIPEPTPVDFPEYRNRNRDGVVTGLTLDRSWAGHPPKMMWELSLGNDAGYAGISVVGPSAVTIEQIGPKEAVVCYDADTGKERWTYEYSALFAEIMGGNGPRTNPTIVDGDVYSLGATGHLARLDGATGKPKWTAEIVAGRNNVYWGQSGSPLVYDHLVVVSPGRNRKGLNKDSTPGTGPAVVAYDRETGKTAWDSGDRGGGYSSPQLATIAGVRQVLVFDGEGLGSFDAESGKELWFHPWTQDPDINVAQPLVFDDGRVFISSGYGHGGAMLKVTLKDGKWNADEELWTTDRLKSKFANPIAHKGYIYGIDESAGSLTCLDARTGKVKWKDGRYGNGQILLVGDLIVIETEKGKLVLVEATPEKHNEVASFQALKGDKNWNYLTVARGRAYVRSHEMMACYELPAKKD
jgi:outer membrane protein assembly factor BamB